MNLITVLPESQAVVIIFHQTRERLIFPLQSGKKFTAKVMAKIHVATLEWVERHYPKQADAQPYQLDVISRYVDNNATRYRKMDMVWSGNPHGLVGYTADLGGGAWDLRKTYIIDMDKPLSEQNDYHAWVRIPEHIRNTFQPCQ
ncbi:hypothetical protein [Vibrio phage V-YDF132]|nr:hypothetical protein [Vibrio phage V-YDF132]